MVWIYFAIEVEITEFILCLKRTGFASLDIADSSKTTPTNCQNSLLCIYNLFMSSRVCYLQLEYKILDLFYCAI